MVLLAGTMSSFIIHAAFKYNQDYIIKALCVNRDKPKLQCHGKCYLKKQLEQDQNQNNSESPLVKSENTMNWIVFSIETKPVYQNETGLTRYHINTLKHQAYPAVEERPPSIEC